MTFKIPETVEEMLKKGMTKEEIIGVKLVELVHLLKSFGMKYTVENLDMRHTLIINEEL